MKRLTALFLCITLFSASFLTGVNAEPAITKDEAAKLVQSMHNFHKSICDTTGDMNILEFSRTEVTDDKTHKRLCQVRPYEEPDYLVFYLLDGDYGKLSFWHQYIGQFLTDNYIKDNVKLNWSLIELDGKVYCVDGPFYFATPALPGLISDGKPLEDRITLVDNDTVLLEAYFDGFEPTKYEVNFEYTDNGWRICGGEATKKFMRYLPLEDTVNPETSNSVTPVIIYLIVSSIGVGVMLKKRRHGE